MTCLHGKTLGVLIILAPTVGLSVVKSCIALLLSKKIHVHHLNGTINMPGHCFMFPIFNIFMQIFSLQCLKQQQEGLQHLMSIIRDDLDDLRIIEQGYTDPPSVHVR